MTFAGSTDIGYAGLLVAVLLIADKLLILLDSFPIVIDEDV